MRLTYRVALWSAACLAVCLGCGDDDVPTPDPVPPARVVAIERFGHTPGGGLGWAEDVYQTTDGVYYWGEEVHVIFDRDPGLVTLDHGTGVRGWDVAGSGTLRAFVVLTSPLTLVWGDGESYDVGVERIIGDGPTLDDIVPFVKDSVVSAVDLNATGIVLAFDEPIGPVDGAPARLIPKWVVEVEIENVATGVTWEPPFSVEDQDLTVLPDEGMPFAAASDYVLRGRVFDAFNGGVATPVSFRFSTR